MDAGPIRHDTSAARAKPALRAVRRHHGACGKLMLEAGHEPLRGISGKAGL